MVVFLSLSLVSLAYFLAAKPFKSKDVNILLVLNEAKLYFCTLLIYFTQTYEYFPTAQLQFEHIMNLGWIIFWTEVVALVLNILYILYQMLRSLFLKIRMKLRLLCMSRKKKA